ncbi:MAG: FixH family protein [Burkholderiales bacterium]|nr:FixH family protein [Burkholderiales bacterium]
MKASQYYTAACLAALVFSVAGCATRPAAGEFGVGPRTSAERRYVATLQPQQVLRPRQLQSMRVSIVDARGQAVNDANILVDGGMPQHGHGLPTKPRVTKSLGGGLYEIEGVRFNMGGWWEFKLAINGVAGADTVTFNLDL